MNSDGLIIQVVCETGQANELKKIGCTDGSSDDGREDDERCLRHVDNSIISII